jgi:hypothetical protein
LILVGSVGLALVLFLSWQSVGLRQRIATTTADLESVRETFGWNLLLSSLEGAPLPDAFAERLRASDELAGLEGDDDVLVIAYMPTVCTTCLRSGLNSLAIVGPRLRDQGTVLHGVTSERRGSREQVVLLRQDGFLDFPVSFIQSETFLESMPGGTSPGFTDTPLYLRLDGDLVVKSAFKADQRNGALLDQWLAASWGGASSR